MPKYILNDDDAYFMSWKPGSAVTTEKVERAEQLANAIATQTPVEECEE